MERYSNDTHLRDRILSFERETKSHFVVRNKDRAFGSDDWRNTEKDKLAWKIPSVPFDGVPFMHVGRKILECHQGKDKNAKKKRDEIRNRFYNDGRLIVQRTKKMGCPAKIHIHHVIKFPEFAVEVGDHPRKQRAKMKRLKKAIAENEEIMTHSYYYVQFPDMSEHVGHPTDGIVAHMREKPDPVIIEHIVNMTNLGVRKLSDMKEHIITFVNENFEATEEDMSTRRRYFPLDQDIKNTMKKARKMSELVKEDLTPPVKKMKVNEDASDSITFEKTIIVKEEINPPIKKITEDNSTGGQICEDEQQFTSLEGFEVVRVLNSNEESKSLAFEARIDGKDGVAVVMLQKLPFNKEKIRDLLTENSKLQNLFENDVYHNKKALLPPEMNEVKATIVYPAEEKHILRFEKQESSFIDETPELYSKVTKPFMEKSQFSKQWIYNILEHKQEADRIVFEDPDPEVGFILLPDMKWTGEQMEDLYLQVIVHRRDITCLRELRSEHLPLLKNIMEKGTKAIEKTYGLPAHKQRVFIHYQPSFYHLHVHFTALSFDAPGTWAGKAHLLSSVISNIEICSDYYAKAVLPFTVKDNHPLRKQFEEYGLI